MYAHVTTDMCCVNTLHPLLYMSFTSFLTAQVFFPTHPRSAFLLAPFLQLHLLPRLSPLRMTRTLPSPIASETALPCTLPSYF